MAQKRETVATLSCGCRAVCWKIKRWARGKEGLRCAGWERGRCEIQRDGCDRPHTFLQALLDQWECS